MAPRALTSLVETAAEARRAELVAAGVDDEARACPVCGRPLRSDNRRGTCARCQRSHLAVRWCACGCGRHLSARSKSPAATVECVRRLAEFKRWALEQLGPRTEEPSSPNGGYLAGAPVTTSAE